MEKEKVLRLLKNELDYFANMPVKVDGEVINLLIDKVAEVYTEFSLSDIFPTLILSCVDSTVFIHEERIKKKFSCKSISVGKVNNIKENFYKHFFSFFLSLEKEFTISDVYYVDKNQEEASLLCSPAAFETFNLSELVYHIDESNDDILKYRGQINKTKIYTYKDLKDIYIIPKAKADKESTITSHDVVYPSATNSSILIGLLIPLMVSINYPDNELTTIENKDLYYMGDFISNDLSLIKRIPKI